MKNREYYDFNQVKVSFGYLTDGCGKKADTPRIMKIEKDNKLLAMFTISSTVEAFQKYNEWLETEEHYEEKKEDSIPIEWIKKYSLDVWEIRWLLEKWEKEKNK